MKDSVNNNGKEVNGFTEEQLEAARLAHLDAQADDITNEEEARKQEAAFAKAERLVEENNLQEELAKQGIKMSKVEITKNLSKHFLLGTIKGVVWAGTGIMGGVLTANLVALFTTSSLAITVGFYGGYILGVTSAIALTELDREEIEDLLKLKSY